MSPPLYGEDTSEERLDSEAFERKSKPKRTLGRDRLTSNQHVGKVANNDVVSVVTLPPEGGPVLRETRTTQCRASHRHLALIDG